MPGNDKRAGQMDILGLYLGHGHMQSVSHLIRLGIQQNKRNQVENVECGVQMWMPVRQQSATKQGKHRIQKRPNTEQKCFFVKGEWPRIKIHKVVDVVVVVVAAAASLPECLLLPLDSECESSSCSQIGGVFVRLARFSFQFSSSSKNTPHLSPFCIILFCIRTGLNTGAPPLPLRPWLLWLPLPDDNPNQTKKRK